MNNLPDVMLWQKLTRTYRHIDRFRQVLVILFRHGFGYVFGRLKKYVPMRLRRGLLGTDKEQTADTLAEQLRLTLTDLGPTFIKLGQILSGRSDLLPEPIVAELSKLQDRLPSFSFEQVRKIIRHDFHGEISDFFSEFSEMPVAAASIAQGHLARLKSGERVFVKVRRPGIEKEIRADLEIAAILADYLEKSNPELGFLHLPRLVSEFARSILSELDLSNEASNMDCFRNQFKGRAGLKVARLWRDLCSRNVITMEYIDGIKATDIAALDAAGIDRKAVAARGAELLLEQFFVHGFFHADPHPGNVFIMPDGTLCYVDFGQMGRLSHREREIFAELISAVVQRDEHMTAKLLLKLCTYDGEPDLNALEMTIAAFISRYGDESLADLNVGDAIRDIYTICQDERISLRPHIYLMMKALSETDAMGRALAPSFSVMEYLKPFVTRTMLRRFDLWAIGRKLYGLYRDYGEVVEALPNDYRRTVDDLRGGRLRLHLHLDETERLRHDLVHGINRMCLAAIQFGLLIASAILMHARIPPTFFGISLFGVLGLLVSYTLFVVMVIDAWRNN